MPIPQPSAAIEAQDDVLSSSVEQIFVDVLANDTHGPGARISSVGEPDVGSASVSGEQIVVDIPPSYSGNVTFTYTIVDDSGQSAVATVSVLSANVLNPSFFSTDASESQVPLDSVGGVITRTGRLLGDLATIRLSTLQLGVLATAPLVVGLFGLVVLRRERLLSITNVARTELATFSSSRITHARHDALVWGVGKRRRARAGKTEVRIELGSGEHV